MCLVVERKIQMKDTKYPSILYHYASMEKAISILKYKNFRLSDITKSNDVNEMSICFPRLFDEMINSYDAYDGFSYEFTYKGKDGREGFGILVKELRERIEKEFEDGTISTFVICLSEEGDLLSQWRGYADDGRGMCLGFNVHELLEFTDASTITGYALEKVQYLSKEALDRWIKNVANELLQLVNIILGAIKDGKIVYSSEVEFDKDIFDTLYYNIIAEIEESIKFKADGFKEEKEWRFFIKNSLNKDEIDKKEYSSIGRLSEETRRKSSEFVDANIDFNVKENDIVPFISLGFDKFHNNLISEVICGPNNMIRKSDLDMFLRKYGYCNCEHRKSSITYIVR